MAIHTYPIEKVSAMVVEPVYQSRAGSKPSTGYLRGDPGDTFDIGSFRLISSHVAGAVICLVA